MRYIAPIRKVVSLSLVVALGACADAPTAPSTTTADASLPSFSVGQFPEDYNLELMATAAAKYGRPYWARNCTPRICVSLRGLIVENEVTETRVAVGSDLFGPYPDWTLEKLEYFLLNKPKGGGPWKLAIITSKDVIQNGQRQYHNRNFTGIKDGDVLCVETHVKGTAKVNGKLNTTATELYTTCSTVRYAVDVKTTIELENDVLEFTNNDMGKVTATFEELRGIRPGTFNAVLLIDGVAVQSLPTLAIAAGGTIPAVEFEFETLTPGWHNISVAAINVLPGDYDLLNNVDTKPLQVTVMDVAPPPPGEEGVEDTRTSQEFCEQENTCPPRFLEYRANQEFDTTFSMTRTTSILDGVSSSTYDINQLTFTHAYATFVDAVWDIEMTFPVDSIFLQQVTREGSDGEWITIDRQDNGSTPALVNLEATTADGQCHIGENNRFGFTLCRVFIDDRWQTRLTYKHERTGTASFPDLETATLFFGPDLDNPTPRDVPGSDYQGVGAITYLGTDIRYAMNVYFPGGKLLQAWALMSIVRTDRGTGGKTTIIDDDCEFDANNCEVVARYNYYGSVWKRGGQALDNARH